MLESEEVISFCPGVSSRSKDEQKRFGTNGYPDRVNVGAKFSRDTLIIPRALAPSTTKRYFSFYCVSERGEQKSTYVNEGVVVLEDILRETTFGRKCRSKIRKCMLKAQNVNNTGTQEDGSMDRTPGSIYVDSVVLDVVHLSAPDPGQIDSSNESVVDT
jgi:hypothetical protein